VFDAPGHSNQLPACPLYETSDGTHLLHMTSLWRPYHHQDPEVFSMQLYAIFLESYEDEVTDIVLGYHDAYLCAVAMIAWHLIDGDASLPHLYRMRVDFMDIEFAVWAVLAFLRDMWALDRFLSSNTFMSYFRCCRHLVHTLRSHDVAVLLVM
jgi:hypothetical protein